jgi:hypothetical protein
MGSFSWLKADSLTRVANIVYDEPFKMLIPQEFGGGFIRDWYQDYGRIGTKENLEPKHDMYELIAFWNREQLNPDQTLQYVGEFPPMKQIDEYTDHNRIIGINIGCGTAKIQKLKYPLKLVSYEFEGTYEELTTPSFEDPNQGFCALRREKR